MQSVGDLRLRGDARFNKDIAQTLLGPLLDRQGGFQLLVGDDPLRFEYVAQTDFSLRQVYKSSPSLIDLTFPHRHERVCLETRYCGAVG